MDHTHPYFFPGLIFLLAQVTYRFVPYGDALLAIILLFFLLSGAAQLLHQFCRRLRRNSAGAL